MTDLEKAYQINERIGLRADGRISVWCAGAWQTSRLIASLLSRIEDLERRLDKQEEYAACEESLRAARRLKPPSLKEQALEELDAAILRGDCFSTSPVKDILRRALESIPDPS